VLALTAFLVAQSGKTTEKVYAKKVRNAKTVLTTVIIVVNVVGMRCCQCLNIVTLSVTRLTYLSTVVSYLHEH